MPYVSSSEVLCKVVRTTGTQYYSGMFFGLFAYVPTMGAEIR